MVTLRVKVWVAVLKSLGIRGMHLAWFLLIFGRLMNFIKTFLYILMLSSAASASAVELCTPLNTNENKDELGGVYSEWLDGYVAKVAESLPEEGWKLIQSTSERKIKTCSRIYIIPKSTVFTDLNRFGHQIQYFFKALEKEKRQIIDFYKGLENKKKRISITDYEYNKLAFLAVGILGAESSAGQSHYYALEHIASQSVILESTYLCLFKYSVENCTSWARTSRGLTQIREVPLISDTYGINRDNLSDSYLAGVATMGYLIESYREYKQKLANKDYVYKALDGDGEEYDKKIEIEQFHIFLTYFYRGDRKQINRGTAQPHKNCYYKRVQKFQEYIDMYVHQDKDCSTAGPSILGEANQ